MGLGGRWRRWRERNLTDEERALRRQQEAEQALAVQRRIEAMRSEGINGGYSSGPNVGDGGWGGGGG